MTLAPTLADEIFSGGGHIFKKLLDDSDSWPPLSPDCLAARMALCSAPSLQLLEDSTPCSVRKTKCSEMELSLLPGGRFTKIVFSFR